MTCSIYRTPSRTGNFIFLLNTNIYICIYLIEKLDHGYRMEASFTTSTMRPNAIMAPPPSPPNTRSRSSSTSTSSSSLPSWGSMRGLPNFWRFGRSSIRKWSAPPASIQTFTATKKKKKKKKKEKFTFTLFLFLSFNLRWIFFNNSFPPSPPLLPSNLFCMNWLTNKLFSLNFFSPFKSVDVCKWMTLNQSCEGFIIICYIEKSRVTCLHWPNFGFWWIQRCIE